MHPAVEGFLIGFALGALLVIYEYFSVKKQVQERAAARHERPVFEPTDKARINAVLRFALLMPLGGAIMFWLWSAAG